MVLVRTVCNPENTIFTFQHLEITNTLYNRSHYYLNQSSVLLNKFRSTNFMVFSLLSILLLKREYVSTLNIQNLG